MRILALDTSTEWLSVAVFDGRTTVVGGERAGNASSERILPLTARVLDEVTQRFKNPGRERHRGAVLSRKRSFFQVDSEFAEFVGLARGSAHWEFRSFRQISASS